ncbi:MAG: hypothetical protein JXL80_05585 [Planctomycetes bacterium]|nr:hypothetical protein [Planctomycetota bacterium]
MNYVYVIAALAAWTSIAFVYRWAESRRGSRYAMATTMGFAGAAWALLFSLCGGIEFGQIARGHLGIGAGQGLILAALIPVFMAAVARGDLSVTWTALTLSFSLAAALALIYPGERPTPLGVSGLVLAALAVGMLGLDMVHRSRGPEHRRPRRGWLLFMAISFVLNGVAGYAYSVASALKPKADLGDMLGFVMAAGLVFGLGGLAMVLFRRRRDGLKAGAVGGLVGGTLWSIGVVATLQALSQGVPGHILYPATTGGSSILVVVLSVILLKERPGRAGWLGLATGLLALVLFGLATSAGGGAH